MEGSSIRPSGGASAQNTLFMQMQTTGEIIFHSGRLRPREISDDEKIKSLIALIGLAVSFEGSEWRGIIAESGVIEALSNLMNETNNPKIRTLCSAVIHIIQQRGSEVGESTDWQSIISPLIPLLFNKDEGISKTGKLSLIDAIGVNPEISKALIEIGLFDKSSEILNQAFSSSSSSQTSDTVLSQNIILNILEVIDKIVKSYEESGQKGKQFKSCSERIIKMKLPRPIKLAIQSILIAIEGESSDNNEEIIQAQLHEAQERIKTLEEQARIGQQREREKDEQIRKSEENVRNEEQMKKDAIQQAKATQEQLKLKDAEIQRLKDDIAQLSSISVPIPVPEQEQTINVNEEDKTSELQNPDENGSYVKFERVIGLKRKAIALQNDKPVVIPLNKEMINGIHSVSVKFEKCNKDGIAYGHVGIAKASHNIPCPCEAWEEPHNTNMLFYNGGDGTIHFRGNTTYGNTQFSDGQLITMELNMDIGTLHFIVDGVQQPVFVRGIKEKWELYYKDSLFTVVSVNQLNIPTVMKLNNEKAFDW